VDLIEFPLLPSPAVNSQLFILQSSPLQAPIETPETHYSMSVLTRQEVHHQADVRWMASPDGVPEQTCEAIFVDAAPSDLFHYALQST
jgi:hypothetical protein